MRILKKFILFCLVCVFMFGSCVGLSSCKTGSFWTGWFKRSELHAVGLDNLPKPDFDYVSSRRVSRDIHGNITEDEFETYAEELLQYLGARFEVMGTKGKSLYDMYGCKYEFVSCEKKVENFGGMEADGSGVYYFLFFTSDNTSGVTQDFVVIERYATPRDESDSYNFIISLKSKMEFTRYVLDGENDY